MKKLESSDLGNSAISREDLRLFYKTLPYRVVINDENYELDSDFLNFIYGLIVNREVNYYNYNIGIDNNELASILENLKKRQGKYGDATINVFGDNESNDNSNINDDNDNIENDAHVDTDDRLLIDIQGLLWENQVQRDRLLKIRQTKHNSFTNISNSKETAKKDVTIELDTSMDCWNFKQYLKVPRPKLSHFQLRNNLVCLNSKKEVFYNEVSSTDSSDSTAYNYPVIKKINTFDGEITTVLDLKHEPLDRISTIDCNDDLLLVGTLNGSYHIKNLKTEQVQKKILTTSSNGIINFIKILDDTILFSANDGALINVDIHTLKKTFEVPFPWAINSISICPFNDKIKLIVGDNVNSFIIDERVHYNRPVNILRGHKDFTFCCDWSNNGTEIVTGNQDATVRLYDIRNLRENKSCLKGEIDSSIRTVGFNQSSDTLVFTESIDYVNIVDMKSITNDYIGSKQVISLFGKIIGSKFTNFDDEDGELLTIGVSDDSIGGILQYELESTRKCIEYDFM